MIHGVPGTGTSRAGVFISVFLSTWSSVLITLPDLLRQCGIELLQEGEDLGLNDSAPSPSWSGSNNTAEQSLKGSFGCGSG